MIDNKALKFAEELIDMAFAEDIGEGDITTNNLIPAGFKKTALLVSKGDGVIAGIPLVEMIYKKFDNKINFEIFYPDGSKVKQGDIIAKIEGSYRTLLTCERIALNFLQHLSGIATYANKCMDTIKKYNVEILDTRKTLPGYRYIQKYAVRTGGASNHRIGLYDMVMIKDNHIQIAGGITQAVSAIRPKLPKSIKIEIETTNLDQVEESIKADADIIMLDNMSNDMMKKAVAIINKRAKIEASGNMNLQRLKEVAATGIDYISIGALTHSVKALDISQRIID